VSKKKIIIVGGSGSIGSCIAREIKNEGFEPILIGRNITSLKSLSDELNCSYEIIDVTESKKLKEYLETNNDNVFGIAYCVGSIELKPFSLTTEQEYIESFKLNTVGAIISIQSLQNTLIKNKGSILLFSTIAVKQGFTNHSLVSTSKGAIEGLTLSLAAELSPDVRVNCIAPSLTESNMSRKLISNENIKKAIENMHPIPKLGHPDDYGKISAFLLGNNNKWITGQIIHVDGGRSTVRKKG